MCGCMNNLLASQVTSSASLQSGNNTHSLSSEWLAVNSEIAYV